MRSEWIVSVDDKGNSEIGVIESAKWEQELIRCKDCKWAIGDVYYGTVCCGKPYSGAISHPIDWFCADGEQKDSE